MTAVLDAGVPKYYLRNIIKIIHAFTQPLMIYLQFDNILLFLLKYINRNIAINIFK